jgi:hypothetical protein
MEVVPRAIRALKRALRVKAPVVGSFKLPRSCAETFVEENVCKSVGPLCGRSVPIKDLPDSYFNDYQCVYARLSRTSAIAVYYPGGGATTNAQLRQ